MCNILFMYYVSMLLRFYFYLLIQSSKKVKYKLDVNAIFCIPWLQFDNNDTHLKFIICRYVMIMNRHNVFSTWIYVIDGIPVFLFLAREHGNIFKNLRHLLTIIQ